LGVSESCSADSPASPSGKERAASNEVEHETKEQRNMADRVIRGVANIWVPVADIERALVFYENIDSYAAR
jgi:hypothetical protein